MRLLACAWLAARAAAASDCTAALAGACGAVSPSFPPWMQLGFSAPRPTPHTG